jgi:hypothetical protein
MDLNECFVLAEVSFLLIFNLNVKNACFYMLNDPILYHQNTGPSYDLVLFQNQPGLQGMRSGILSRVALSFI